MTLYEYTQYHSATTQAHSNYFLHKDQILGLRSSLIHVGMWYYIWDHCEIIVRSSLLGSGWNVAWALADDQLVRLLLD